MPGSCDVANDIQTLLQETKGNLPPRRRTPCQDAEREMSICGYDPKMGTGLEKFSEGLIAAIRTKADLHHNSESTQMAVEADQIAILLTFLGEQLPNADSPSRPHSLVPAFFGLVMLCKGLFGPQLTVERADSDLQSVVTTRTKQLIELLVAFEKTYDRAPVGLAASDRTLLAWRSVAPLLRPPATAVVR